MNLTKLVWAIAIHSIIHGVFGAFFVASSEYVNKKPELIYTFLFLNIVLIFFGVGVPCIILWRRPFCAKVLGAALIIIALAYLILGIIYLVKYFPFYANSLADIFVFRTDIICWVGPESAMTFWHVLTIILLLAMFIFIVYGFLLCKYAALACCIPCPPPPCKPKPPKPKKCLPVCPLGPPCQPPVLPEVCNPPCPPPPPTCAGPCPPPKCPPPPCPPCPKKPPKFVMNVNKGICN